MSYFTSTSSFDNDFFVAKYETSSREVFTSPENWMPGDTTPKTITTKNEGNIDIRVRVRCIEEWTSANGDILPSKVNGESAAIINLINTDKWTKIGNYYYYSDDLEPNEETNSFMESVTFNPNIEANIVSTTNGNTKTCTSSGDGYDNATYTLTILIETIQAEVADQIWDPSEDDGTLYGVVRRDSNNNYSLLYNGEHQDSITRTASKNIYYYSSDGLNSRVEEKINVVFGGYCWKILRTTDTGGVKMIYNGVAIDDTCTSNLDTYGVVMQSETSQSIVGDYAYGSDFTYDSDSRTFKISGNIRTANYLNDQSVIGLYTCKNANPNESCSTIYYLKEKSDQPQHAMINNYSFGQINKSLIARVPYNLGENSLSYVGYMYNDVYPVESSESHETERFYNSEIIGYNSSLTGIISYSDTIDYDNINPGKYTLVNPASVSFAYTSLIGKYIIKNDPHTQNGLEACYVVDVNGYNFNCKVLSNGDLSTTFTFSQSITDNGNNTWNLNNPVSVSYLEYLQNYSTYENRYTCFNGNTTCSNPKYINYYSTTTIRYVPVKKILVAKSRSDLNLTNTLITQTDEISKNPSSFSMYKYTCNTTSSTCTENTLRMIISYTETSYVYYPNKYFGDGVRWTGTNYMLYANAGVESTNDATSLKTQHYSCVGNGDICEKAMYIHYCERNSHKCTYTILENGKDITDIIGDMLNSNNVNKKSSFIKKIIDNWYTDNLINYDQYLEETIYCGSRSISDYGGFNPRNGSVYDSLVFNNLSDSFSCINETDKFSVSNEIAKLNYKIGLASYAEYRKCRPFTGDSYWLITPNKFTDDKAYNWLNSYTVNKASGVRPVISLNPDVIVKSGDGSTSNPYLIEY